MLRDKTMYLPCIFSQREDCMILETKLFGGKKNGQRAKPRL